ncbi:hypothetical protein [Paraurantiacibacter namhicola]|uniref:Oligosaccharide repeat unit polymerase n=1 Tax=Paraurantiacibacter namhicola TaxID=645517 RepID=A0A1C7D623_9SPHN|nr:hypothetical protein [Paraurantiacibacter namhicola]ANU06908.1 hypothetical protein A6F65_00586 [Paraurantiacibacter namhicola]
MYDFILWLNLLVWLGFCALFASRPNASLFHPGAFYLAFHGFVFTIRPIIAWYRGYDRLYEIFGFTPSIEVKTTVIAASMLGKIAFMTATMASARSPMAFKSGPEHAVQERLLDKPFLLAVAILGPIGLYSVYYFSTEVLGSPGWGMARDAASGIAYNTRHNGYVLSAQFLLVPLCAVFAWRMRFVWWSLIPSVLFIVQRAGSGIRGPFIALCIALLLLWLWQNRRRWPSAVTLPAAAIVLVLFVQVGEYRGTLVRSILEPDRIELTGSGYDMRMLEGMHTANMEFFEYLVLTVPEKSGTYGYFVENLQVFTEPVPRVLWKDKPKGAPIPMFDWGKLGRPVGMTSSLPGEGWTQLGWLGVIIWCGLAGLVMGRAYEWFVRSRQSVFAVLAYIMFLPQCVLFFRDGLLLSPLRDGIFYLFPIGLMWVLYRAMDFPPLRHLARLVNGDLAAPSAASAIPNELAGMTPSQRRRKLASRLDG